VVADVSRLAGLLDHSLPKTFRRGTHRTLTPEETLAHIRPLAARLGITRLGNITGLDRIGIPVAIAVRPNARSVSVSQGKGLALPQAMASALMEAAEGFHAEAIGDAPWRVAPYRVLRAAAEPVVEVDRLCGTGTPLDPDTPIGWLRGHDLLRREPCWVPAELVHTDTTRPLDGYFPAGSNGLASGNHLGEAVGAALCELVERDSIAQWDAAGVGVRASRALDLASVEEAACRALLNQYAAAGIVVRVWDITTDVGIAAFLCHIGESGDGVPGLRRFRGAGCHPDRAVALARALTEAAQVRLTYIAGIRDDLSAAEYDQPAGEAIGAALLDALAAERRPVAFGDVPSVVTDDCIDDVRFALERLRAVGLSRVVVLDLTDPAFAIPVVRLVIPGLEGDPRHPLYTPGRRAQRAHGP
jgi:ribosomal protein S12 methylthiotransferase accessory factor